MPAMPHADREDPDRRRRKERADAKRHKKRHAASDPSEAVREALTVLSRSEGPIATHTIQQRMTSDKFIGGVARSLLSRGFARRTSEGLYEVTRKGAREAKSL